MVRRFAQVSLAIFLVLALATMASAASNTANTTQKGSLLVFPKVEEFSTQNVHTYFFIANDNTVGTYVKCYWMDNNQSVEDFHFYLTANQPIVFSTQYNNYGPPFGDNIVGSLACWAQDDLDYNPRNFNHLYGYAMLTPTNFFYNAYSFAMRDPATALAQFTDGGWGLNLEGATTAGVPRGYDACPKYLITTFVPQGGALGNPDLTLWPCKQDLRQDRLPTCTKAKFDIWNWNEVKFTGAYQCFKCFFEGFLHEIGRPELGPIAKWVYKRGPGFGGEKFTLPVLGYDVTNPAFVTWTPARMRVQGIRSNAVCIGQADPLTWANRANSKTRALYDGIYCTDTVATGLLGVILYGTPTAFNPANLLNAPGIIPTQGYTMHGAGIANAASGAGGPGWIKYDRGEPVIDEAAGR